MAAWMAGNESVIGTLWGTTHTTSANLWCCPSQHLCFQPHKNIMLHLVAVMGRPDAVGWDQAILRVVMLILNAIIFMDHSAAYTQKHFFCRVGRERTLIGGI